MGHAEQRTADARLTALIGEWDVEGTMPIEPPIGEGEAGLAQHDFDSRGVARVYAMTITDEAWTLAREHPGFSQRFVGAFSGDGRVIDGRWEICRDGSNWGLDFRLMYTKSS
jgi:hypothetical protein